jgi:hypothetical protein
MRAPFRAAATLFLLTSLALGSSETTSDLKTRADASHGGEQAKYSLEYARRVLEASNDLFTKGDVDKAQAEIREVVDYAHKAANAASSSGKRQKQTEIGLRELAKRMHDIGDTLAFEDRGPVRQAVDEIEQLRSELLARMFQN